MTSLVTAGHRARVVAAGTGFAAVRATKAARMSECMMVANKETNKQDLKLSVYKIEARIGSYTYALTLPAPHGTMPHYKLGHLGSFSAQKRLVVCARSA